MCDKVKRLHQDLDGHCDENRMRFAANKEELGKRMEVLAGGKGGETSVEVKRKQCSVTFMFRWLFKA